MAQDLNRQHIWSKTINDESYVITTTNAHLDRSFINKSFASEDMYWAKELPLETLETMLSHSINLGLYRIKPTGPTSNSNPKSKSNHDNSKIVDGSTIQAISAVQSDPYQTDTLEQIGFARLSTDFVTIAYLTDVYVAPEHRRTGLATWLIESCDATIKTLPALRNVLLVAGDKVVEFYKSRMGMKDVREEKGWTIMHRATWNETNHS